MIAFLVGVLVGMLLQLLWGLIVDGFIDFLQWLGLL